MNSNLFHNLANAGIILCGAATGALLASGCTEVIATGAVECSKSFINPAWTAMAASFLGIAKVAVNLVRDGFAGLSKPQPPVVP